MTTRSTVLRVWGHANQCGRSVPCCSSHWPRALHPGRNSLPASVSRAPAAGGPATAAAVSWRAPKGVANVPGPCASTGQARPSTLADLRRLGVPVNEGVLLAAVQDEAAQPRCCVPVYGGIRLSAMLHPPLQPTG